MRLAIPHDTRPDALVAHPQGRIHDMGGRTMGTTWSARLIMADSAGLPQLKAQAQAALDSVVAQMSQWEPDSDLSRFNRAPAGSWHRLPGGFATVMAQALAVARLTDGAFDPALGAASEAWGFGAGPVQTWSAVPPFSAAASPYEGPPWQAITFDAAQGRLRQSGHDRLDLCAIAKGFGVDELARVLSEAGIESFLVEAGGELRGHGLKPDRQPWWVEVENPPGAPFAPLRMALLDHALATSADHRRNHHVHGIRLGHTLDPRTRAPARHAAQAVSVLADTAMQADALATALMVMGKHALDFATDHAIAARIVLMQDDAWIEHLSPELQKMMD